jgi:hypothetical protein
MDGARSHFFHGEAIQLMAPGRRPLNARKRPAGELLGAMRPPINEPAVVGAAG